MIVQIGRFVGAVLERRRNTTTGELAFYRCWTPDPATLAQLVRVAGVRWVVEESFQAERARSVLISTKAAAGRPGIG